VGGESDGNWKNWYGGWASLWPSGPRGVVYRDCNPGRGEVRWVEDDVVDLEARLFVGLGDVEDVEWRGRRLRLEDVDVDLRS
jgi:hypothetical protein